jgi:hypothetical protein
MTNTLFNLTNLQRRFQVEIKYKAGISTFDRYFVTKGLMLISATINRSTNALIVQCIGTQHSHTFFGTLKCHHQGVKHDPAEISAQCRGKQGRVGTVYCNRRLEGRDITE